MRSLEYLYGAEPGPHLAELAHHAMAGRAFEQGVRFARGAGHRALALLAFEEAGRLYRAALDALEAAEPANGRARCELLLALGEAENRAGDSPAAKRAFGAAADIARRLHLPTSLARAALGYGGRMGWGRAGRDDRLVPLLEEALAALADDELELRARVLARLAGALRDEPSRDRRDRLSAEAVELARRSASDDALAYALDGRAVAVCAPDAIEEGLALGTELCEVARRTGDPERIMAGYDTRIIALLQSGQVGAAEADVAAALSLAQEVKQPARLWEAHGHQTLLALATGRLDEAEALIPKALVLGERAVPDGAIPVHRTHRYTLCDFRGGLEEVEPAIRELIADYPARPLFRCVLAHIHARLGRIDEARRILDELAADDFATVPFDQEWLYAMSILAETCVLVDDVATAAVLYRLILPWEALCGADPGEGMRGSLARELGLLATALGRFDDADRHFADAIAANDAMGALPWLARAQADHARMLRARGDPGDRERADKLDAAARATFADLDIQGD
jgi:eukaryotic-like serine/threonine-protein kinase